MRTRSKLLASIAPGVLAALASLPAPAAAQERTLAGDTPSEPKPIAWGHRTEARQPGRRFFYLCPPGGSDGHRVWGTDVYTDDSSICTAAVHAGLITFERGGSVGIELLPERGSYTGSERNGVTSSNWGHWGGSYMFITGNAAGIPGQPLLSDPVPAPDLAGPIEAPPGVEDVKGVTVNDSGGLTIERRNPDGSTSTSTATTKTLPDSSVVIRERKPGGMGGLLGQTLFTPQGDILTAKADSEKVSAATLANDGTVTALENRKDEAVVVQGDPDGAVVSQRNGPEGRETVTQRPDGWVDHVDAEGNLRSSYTGDDGKTTTVAVDRDGNTTTTVTDSSGAVVTRVAQELTPAEPGRRYFEEVLGGTDWEQLPRSYRNRYADSERDIQRREAARAEEDAAAARKRAGEMTRQVEDEKSRAELDRKLAEIQAEETAAKERAAELRARAERSREIAASREKTRELRRKHYEAASRGDSAEVKRLEREMDRHSDASMELLATTPDEEREMDRQAAVRSALANQLNTRASAIAEAELGAIEADQQAKENITAKTKWVSIGSQMQQQTKATTRAAERERVTAEVKQREIRRMLGEKGLTSEQRRILTEMDRLAVLQEEGAERMLRDNASITAAGYGLDVALTVTGGKLVEAGRRATVGTAGVVAGERAAAATARTLSTDLTAPAVEAGARTARRLVGDKVADAAGAVTQRVGEVARTDVRELAGARPAGGAGAPSGSRTLPEAPAPAKRPWEMTIPERQAYQDRIALEGVQEVLRARGVRPSSPAPTPSKPPSQMTPAERQAYNIELSRRAIEPYRHLIDEPLERVLDIPPPVGRGVQPGPREPIPSASSYTASEVRRLHQPNARLSPADVARKAQLYRLRLQLGQAVQRAADARRPVAEIQALARDLEHVNQLLAEALRR